MFLLLLDINVDDLAVFIEFNLLLLRAFYNCHPWHRCSPRLRKRLSLVMQGLRLRIEFYLLLLDHFSYVSHLLGLGWALLGHSHLDYHFLTVAAGGLFSWYQRHPIVLCCGTLAHFVSHQGQRRLAALCHFRTLNLQFQALDTPKHYIGASLCQVLNSMRNKL